MLSLKDEVQQLREKLKILEEDLTKEREKSRRLEAELSEIRVT